MRNRPSVRKASLANNQNFSFLTVSYMNLRFHLGDFNAMKREFNARESSMIKNLHNRQIMILKNNFKVLKAFERNSKEAFLI